MAEWNEEGLDELMASLERVADIPEEVLHEMLHAQADVVEAGQKDALKRMERKYGTGKLEDSIGSGKVKRDKSGIPCVYVYPRGKREKGKTSNGEVGFLLEYGAPGRGIGPRSWMRTANLRSEETAREKAEEVYGRFLENEGF